MATLLEISILLALVCVVTGQGGNGQCSPGFVGYRGSCFKMFPLAVTWPEAVVLCRTFGAKLASVQDQNQQTFIQDYIAGLANVSLSFDIWMDGSDLLVEGEWLWVTSNRQIGYKNWAPGEPSNGGGGEDCLALAPSLSYKWNDAPCTSRMMFVCETTF